MELGVDGVSRVLLSFPSSACVVTRAARSFIFAARALSGRPKKSIYTTKISTMQRMRLLAARRYGLAARSFSSTATRAAINKIYPSAQEAIKDMKSDTTILVGGFGFSGVPNTLINAVRDRSDLGNFTVVSNNAGMPGVGLGQLLDTKQIGKMIASFIGENKTFERMYLTGELALELTPQGTIAEKCAAGAAGVPAFYTPAAVGTIGMSLQSS